MGVWFAHCGGETNGIFPPLLCSMAAPFDCTVFMLWSLSMVLVKAVRAEGVGLELEVRSLDGGRRARAAAFSELQPAGTSLGARQLSGSVAQS